MKRGNRTFIALLIGAYALSSGALADVIPACVGRSDEAVVDLGEPLKDPSALADLRKSRPDEAESILGILDWLLRVPKPDYDLASLGASDVCTVMTYPTMPTTHVVSFTLGATRYRLRIQFHPAPYSR